MLDISARSWLVVDYSYVKFLLYFCVVQDLNDPVNMPTMFFLTHGDKLVENRLGSGTGAFCHELQDIPEDLEGLWSRSHFFFLGGSPSFVGLRGCGHGPLADPGDGGGGQDIPNGLDGWLVAPWCNYRLVVSAATRARKPGSGPILIAKVLTEGIAGA